MRVFIYQAALLCELCGNTTRDRLDAQGKRPENVGDERTFDSDDYPKGPYPDGGGEADGPQHCDHCACFLENPLTDDGLRYTAEMIAENKPDSVAVREWAPFYGLDKPELVRQALER